MLCEGKDEAVRLSVQRRRSYSLRRNNVLFLRPARVGSGVPAISFGLVRPVQAERAFREPRYILGAYTRGRVRRNVLLVCSSTWPYCFPRLKGQTLGRRRAAIVAP